jgi:hypothetical protein
MPECECTPRCPFFGGKMSQIMPVIVEAMRKQYCLGDNSNCARYMVRQALGSPQAVPEDLTPNQVEVAKQVIAAAQAHAA